jgi:sulfur carrier protein
MEIIVNGEQRQVSAGTTVAALLAALAANPRYVAVEVNLQLVPRGRHAELQLSNGDRVEIVTLVGGG